MATVVVTFGAVDITDRVVFSTARFVSQCNGVAGTCEFLIRDEGGDQTYPVDSDLLLTIDGQAEWRGFATQIKRTYIFDASNPSPARFFKVLGADNNLLFTRRIVFNQTTPENVLGTLYPVGTPDTTAIADLVANFLDLSGDGIDTSTKVVNVADITVAQPGRAWSGGDTWGQAMSSIARLPGAVFYLDPDGYLVYADAETATAPFGLSDTPEQPGVPATITWRMFEDWQPNTFFEAGSELNYVRQPSTTSFWGAPGGGTSGATEPDWGAGQPVPDNDMLWYGPFTDTEVASGPWAAGDPVSFGRRVTPSTPDGRLFGDITDGVFVIPVGATEPTWPMSGTVDEAVETQSGDPGTVGYREFEVLFDGTRLVNDVLAIGAGYGSSKPIASRVIDASSVSTHNRWQEGKTEFGVYKQATLDYDTNSVVYGSPESLRGGKDDKVAVICTTFVPGLRVAMKVPFFANQFGYSTTLPIRRCEIDFPTPSTPRYRLTISSEIDAPFSLIDNLLITIVIPPPPPPPVPIICGITDSFNRPDDPTGLGIADCGRTWTVQIAAPMTIDSNLMRVPTGIAGDRSSLLPGPYPVPFNGQIVATDADIHPGFTYVTPTAPPALSSFGPAFQGGGFGGAGYVDGTALVLEAGNLTNGYGTVGAGTKDDRILFDEDAAVNFTGHIRLVETHPGTSGKAIDEYIEISGPGWTVANSVAIFGNPPGSIDVATLVLFGGLAYVDFPSNWWRDVGEADFTVDYTGGLGGDLSVTLGPVSGSVTLGPTDRLGGRGIGFDNQASTAGSPTNPTNDTWTTLYASDALVNGNAITDINWEWRIEGIDSGGGGVSFRFGYVSMGGRIPFTIDLFVGDPDKWPHTVPSPAIWAYLAGQLTILPLGADLAWPFTPIVTIIGTTATLTVGGDSVSVTTALPVVSLGDTSSFALGHYVRNGQGDYAHFNDLNVVGVNNCAANGNKNWWSQEFVADGSDTFTVLPFVPGTAGVFVNGFRQRLGADYTENPTAGTVTFSTPPTVGAVVVVSYYPA